MSERQATPIAAAETPTAEEPPEPAAPRSGARLQALRHTQRSWSVLVLAALIVLFSATRPDQFVSWFNAKSIAVDASSYLLIAVGMTFVITIGGFDLSGGSVLVFPGVVSLKTMLAIGGDGPVTVLAGLGAALLSGLVWGLINGLVTTRGGISPLIATLGSFAAATGLAYIIAGGQDMHGVPAGLANVLGY